MKTYIKFINEGVIHDFKVGDNVVLNNLIKKDAPDWSKKFKNLFSCVAEIFEITHKNTIKIQFDEHEVSVHVYPKWIDLYEEKLDDRFEKWEEKVNEENHYKEGLYNIGDEVKIISDLNIEKSYNGVAINRIMLMYKDMKTIITNKNTEYVSARYSLKIDGGDWIWTDDMFELEEPDWDRFEKWEED